MDKKSDIPDEGNRVTIVGKSDFFLTGKTGTVIELDTKTYVAVVQLDKPLEDNAQEIPVHINKLEPLE